MPKSVTQEQSSIFIPKTVFKAVQRNSADTPEAKAADVSQYLD